MALRDRQPEETLVRAACRCAWNWEGLQWLARSSAQVRCVTSKEAYQLSPRSHILSVLTLLCLSFPICGRRMVGCC